MDTRAKFLELVPSLSTSDFLLTLRKFISLYRKPEVIHSDNGTNFVGAERELREAAAEMYAAKEIPEYMKGASIHWNFQPSLTPHFGGAHESLVRSTKKALYNAFEQEKIGLRLPREDVFRTLEINKGFGQGIWNIGHFTKVCPELDKCVRVVGLQFKTGTFRRGISELSLLESCSTVKTASGRMERRKYNLATSSIVLVRMTFHTSFLFPCLLSFLQSSA